MSTKTLATAAVMVLGVAVSGSALAGCGGNRHRTVHVHHNHHAHVVHRKVVVHRPVIINHCHHPRHCLAYVRPGETLLTICVREYGNPNFWTKVARFNRMPLNAPLAVGQPIKLPKIYDDGSMALSTAPAPPAPAIVAPVAVPAPAVGIAPAPIGRPALPRTGQPGLPLQQLPGQQATQPAPQQPQANVRQAERVTPTFTVGSQLVLDGQDFGGTPGRVELMVGPMSIPMQIANWTPNEVKIQLPMLNLTDTADARVVIMDSQGKLVTSSNIRLTPAASRLAMDN